MIPTMMRDKIKHFLFSFSNTHLFAVIDGASTQGLLEAIKKNSPEYYPLLSGKLAPELAEVAPYLVKLEKTSPLTEWLLDGWGKHTGIFCIVEKSILIEDVRKHFRHILTVKNHNDKILLFRFYDPRVMSQYLPTCTPEEIKQVFGPVTMFVLEGENENTLRRYSPEPAGVMCKEFSYTLSQTEKDSMPPEQAFS